MVNKSVSDDFSVVCIGGASAEISTYSDVIRRLSPNLNLAVVIINHLNLVIDRLLEVLPGLTPMPVELIHDRLALQANHIFISPGERELHIVDREFRLKPISKPTGWPDVITVFLRSLAKNWRGQLIVVICSGYDGDGADALPEIRKVGGIVLVQKADTARQPDMPLNAMASGCVDFVLSLQSIAHEIERISLSVLPGSVIAR